MKIISFINIKGGVGKTSLLVLIANYLKNIGKKILVIDLDLQNSLSFYYFPENNSILDTKNIANGLFNNDLISNIIKTENDIDLIASSFNLIKLRSINKNLFKKLIDSIKNNYDFILLDCSPTYDNLIHSAIVTSDIILTPAYLTLFDYKGLNFLRDQIYLETDEKLLNWKIVINRFKESRSDNPEAKTNQYLDVFQSNFDNILQTKIPDSVFVQESIDMKTKISESKNKVKLFNSIRLLILELFNIQEVPENF